MRLVQRHGRIDRIGSTHNRVFLRTIFPAERLDQLLNLEKRILDKIARAAASIGVEAPVAHGTHGRQVFTETGDEIQRLLREDATLYERGGTAAATQTGEEYRQTLRKVLAENRDRIVNLPWKAASGMAKGQESGVLFCAAVDPRTYLRYIWTDANWQPIELPEDAATGEPGGLAIESELGTCLRLAECEPQTPRVLPKSLEEDVIFDLWEVAQQDIWRAWMLETDPANLQPNVRPLNRRVADFIRANQPPEVDAACINTALDVVESPWPRREETMLREWFGDDTRAGTARAVYLIDQILETGLGPFRGSDPLPPIRFDEIELVCWLALSPTPGSPRWTADWHSRPGCVAMPLASGIDHGRERGQDGADQDGKGKGSSAVYLVAAIRYFGRADRRPCRRIRTKGEPFQSIERRRICQRPRWVRQAALGRDSSVSAICSPHFLREFGSGDTLGIPIANSVTTAILHLLI